MNITKILIGIDDNKYAEHAAEYGFELARQFKATVGLINIIEPMIMPGTIGGTDPMMATTLNSTGIPDLELLDIQKNEAENIVDRAIKKHGGEMKVAHFTDYGSTADGIIDCGKEFGADLIVVGTHSRSGLDRLLSGSVAEHVVRHSKVPVLVVPFKESESQ